uniref:MULE transposase domain-containing protein n=1 Tax=Tanacetum cinerariifolium TaxID=118510 RepID=A0A6L2MHL0_TANCI|nr:hypothetical protein [Tanacetum cinerariifolium]
MSFAVPYLAHPRSTGPTATLGQATTLPHAFTAVILHDPAPAAWNMNTCASSHLNNSITSLSENYNTFVTSATIDVDQQQMVKTFGVVRLTDDGEMYKMVFVPFTGIDNHHHSVTFAADLLSNETSKTYEWLLRAFMAVVTDHDPSMNIAIGKEFSNSKH